jgi:hypothetical protein
MNIQQLRTNETSKANDLISDFVKDVNVQPKRVVDTEKYGWMGRRHFDDVTLWAFYFHDALPYRIRYCDCILYRQVGQILQE